MDTNTIKRQEWLKEKQSKERFFSMEKIIQITVTVNKGHTLLFGLGESGNVYYSTEGRDGWTKVLPSFEDKRKEEE